MSESELPSNPDRIESILKRYERPLLGYAIRLTGDIESARDVVQETFLRLLRKRHVSLNGRMAPWLFAVCRSRAMDARRKAGRAVSLTEQAPCCGTSDSDPLHMAEQREGASRALTIMAALPLNQQEVIRLRFQGGLSYKQIAKVTGLSVTNVGYLIHTAIKTIRERMHREPRASSPRGRSDGGND